MASKEEERSELLRGIFGDALVEDTDAANAVPTGALVKPFDEWLANSKPFMAFAQTYQRKIAKKVRMSRDGEELYNLYCELRTAYLLLQEQSFAVAYEAQSKEQGRSADFAVTFRTNTTFQVEVTRLRVSLQEQQLVQGAPAAATMEEQRELLRRVEGRRLCDVVCDKFGQLSPTSPNVLWVWSESHALLEVEVGAVLAALKRGVEQRDGTLLARYRLEKPADFMRGFQRLSALVVQPLPGEGASHAPLWWVNRDARHPLPSRVGTLLRGLMAGDGSLPFVWGQNQKSE